MPRHSHQLPTGRAPTANTGEITPEAARPGLVGAAVPAVPGRATDPLRAEGLSQALRSATAPAHRAIEATRIATAMISGSIDRAAYGRLLAQLLPVHSALEAALATRGALWAVPPPLIQRSSAIASDLVALGAPASAERADAARVREWLEQADAARLVGASYVVAGSLMGSRVLAPILRRALRLAPGPGTGIDYHELGASVIAEAWPGLLAGLDRLDLDPAQRAQAVAGAQGMMEGLLAIYAAAGTEPATAEAIP